MGTTDPDLAHNFYVPVNEEERRLCNNQIRSSEYTSFSLFGHLLTYITGSLVIITLFVLEPVLERVYKRRRYREYEYLEWTTNEVFQLQRLAQDKPGYDEWKGCTGNVPTTENGCLLASLDVSNPKHPILYREAESPMDDAKEQPSMVDTILEDDNAQMPSVENKGKGEEGNDR
ncbi:hypothetical protein SCAR479_10933 [Seiridium cardinale]|uniref:Uncharacterized protein n=1 Tax=Seiridium cardinale TaxID=138064 RepID=A0ABR2XF00_9PEZI